MFTDDISTSLIIILARRSRSLVYRLTCSTILIRSYVARHKFRLRRLLNSFIHVTGRKLFAAKSGCVSVSNRQLIVHIIFVAIEIDLRTQ